MGKRNKRARTILKKMSILEEVPSLQVARRLGIEKLVQAEIDKREAETERQRLIEEAKKRAEAEKKAKEEAKKKAELEKKKKAEAARKKKEMAKKAEEDNKASE